MRLPPAIDQEVFYDQLQTVCRNDCEHGIVSLLWRTGMHASTLVEKAFQLNPLTDKTTEVRWRRTKNSKHLVAHLPQSEARVLRRCLAAGSLPDTQRALRWRLQRVGERAGYPGITPLTLRHSRAIYLLDSGRPINRVAALLGCSWQVLERHYAVIENQREVSR